jgi:hypothetical protein
VAVRGAVGMRSGATAWWRGGADGMWRSVPSRIPSLSRLSVCPGSPRQGDALADRRVERCVPEDGWPGGDCNRMACDKTRQDDADSARGL